MPYLVVGALVGVALLYTTPWDNDLVATGVWWYDPKLVTGITLGWVPIEEYTFFVLQTLLTGLWALWVRARTPRSETCGEPKGRTCGEPKGRIFGEQRPIDELSATFSEQKETCTKVGQGLRALSLKWRKWVLVIGGGLWVGALALWHAPWQPGTYITLILSWAFPPILIQLLFGADILWINRRRLWAAVAPPTLYLWIVDFLAIRSGTWTLDPKQTLGVELGGVLAVEEMIFFLVTNVLIVFGLFLVLAEVSHRRVWRMLALGLERVQ
jgi:lycopene cyclase domain-containing protein